MTYETIMNVRAEALYDKLIESLVYEIKAATGNREVKAKTIKTGYFYINKLRTKTGSANTVKVTFDKIERPRIILMTFAGAFESVTVSYRLESLNQAVKVIYQEDAVFDSALMQGNQILMSFLYKRSFKKKIKQKFEAIEQALSTANCK